MNVASIFQDNMVLQRERPIPVWGWAAPGARVTAALRGAGVSAAAVADDQGAWSLALPACAAGGPYELAVASDGETTTLHNVLVGEVWVCSGQSNMEWTVGMTTNADQETAAARHPAIRMLNVEKTATLERQRALKGNWRACAPETVGTFSAVGYFFARELHRRLGVPVGMINSSWGGTVAEAWTSRESLQADPALRHFVTKLDEAMSTDGLRTQDEYRQAMEEWNRRYIPQDPGNVGYGQALADPETDASVWPTMDLPQAWQMAGHEYSGVFWFRREIEMPAGWAGRDVALNIGACDKNDTTYFNNEKVGSLSMEERPDAWCTPRAYTVPGRLVRPGRNTIAVRVASNLYHGGMIGPADTMWVAPAGAPPAERIKLAGEWRYRIEHNFGLVSVNPPPAPLGEGNANTPTILHNAMIAPVAPYGIRGAIWYQGESNVGRAEEYRALLPAMIGDWRRAWGLPDFPFYFVQLANYMPAKEQPAESAWAALREAQRATLALPGTGMAVIIDIGEATDIHPRNKQDVGGRLARIALAQTYGQDGMTWSGPAPRTARRQGAQVRVRFDHAGGGLIARDGDLKGFALAAADRVFHWADARIAGKNAVALSCPAVPAPCWVRYAWADNPVCNLYNDAELPATPFEMEVSAARSRKARSRKAGAREE